MGMKRNVWYVALMVLIAVLSINADCQGSDGKDGAQGPPGTTDHGSLTGLSDNDHPQYQMDVNDFSQCAPGWAIRQINDDGSVICEFDDFGSGVPDHGSLTGLGDDDHPQYQLATARGCGGSGLVKQIYRDGNILCSDPAITEQDTLNSVVGRNPRTSYFAYFDAGLQSSSSSGYAVLASAANSGVSSCVNCGAIRAESTLGQGGYIRTADTASYGLRVRNTNGSAYPGLYVDGTSYFSGNINKAGGGFLIDHPLDPRNKILRHSFVESPDALNIYKGRARLSEGAALIVLPDYFDGLNKVDEREIVLTPVNGWSPLFLEGEIVGNQFVVRTTEAGNPSQEFSWVVLAERADPFAINNPIVVEEEKGVNNIFGRGECIHPEACEGR